MSRLAVVATLLVAVLVVVRPPTSSGESGDSRDTDIADTWASAAVGEPRASAQDDPGVSAQEAAVVEAIHALFDAMKAKDTEALAALFHPEARLLSTSVQGGSTVVQSVAIPDFVASVGSSPADLEERIWDEEVRVDGPLATAWTPYAFFVDGEFSHCGVNSFQLARMEEGWRIVHVMDTRRAEDCPEGAPR